MSRLERPETMRAIWRVSLVLLALLALLDLAYLAIDPESEHALHTHFEVDTYGFYSWFGFLSCVVLVLFAKGIGLLLKRKDTYYDDE